ncbi:MAG: hypothetical protein Q4D38_11500 [Planctomycetia bacterium]|nr:hypothetical protein [Planctomycetia bacterium]
MKTDGGDDESRRLTMSRGRKMAPGTCPFERLCPAIQSALDTCTIA